MCGTDVCGGYMMPHPTVELYAKNHVAKKNSEKNTHKVRMRKREEVAAAKEMS